MAFEAYGEAVVYRVRGAKAAAQLGAAASLIRSVGGADYRLPHTGYSVPAGNSGRRARRRRCRTGRTSRRPGTRPHAPHAYSAEPSRRHRLQRRRRPEGQRASRADRRSSPGTSIPGTSAGSDRRRRGVAMAMATAEDSFSGCTFARAARCASSPGWTRKMAAVEVRRTPKLTRRKLPNHIAAIESDAGAGHPLGFYMKMPPAAIASLRPLMRHPAAGRVRLFFARLNIVPGPTSIRWWKLASRASESFRTAASISTTITAPPTLWTKWIRKNCARTPPRWQ